LQDDVRTGSVVVNFDPNAIEIAILETRLDFAVDQVLVERLTLPPITKNSSTAIIKLP
jgi:hypothetical protein